MQVKAAEPRLQCIARLRSPEGQRCRGRLSFAPFFAAKERGHTAEAGEFNKVLVYAKSQRNNKSGGNALNNT